MKRIRKPRPLKQKYQEIVRELEHPLHAIQPEALTIDLARNEEILKEIFEDCSDIVFRPITVKNDASMLLVYVDGLTDTKHLDDVILKPLMFQGKPDGLTKLEWLGQMLEEQFVPVGQTKVVSQLDDVVLNILKGEVAVFVDGEQSVLIASLKSFEVRSIQEPQSEPVIRGPREGFIENLRTNTSLLRRRIKSPRLKMEPLTVGELSQSDLVITYIKGIAPDAIVNEVRKRLKQIRIDGVLESGYVEEFIEEAPYSPFPQVLNSERPDVVVGNLLEGKVAILTDGTPFALIVPATFWSGLQASEDYYERAYMATAMRWIRFMLVLIALTLPSLYVALVTYEQQMIPTALLLSIAAAQEQTPFPAVFEAFLMEIMFEALREAGVRLPKAVGSAVSIVGALVIGQAAVQAGIVSAPMVIVVSTTGIASFTIPRFNFGISIRLLRFPILLFAGFMGFYGIAIGLLIVLIHITSLRSFGIPYFAPVAPLTLKDLKDVFIRQRWWAMNSRPELTSYEESERIPKGQQPNARKG